MSWLSDSLGCQPIQFRLQEAAAQVSHVIEAVAMQRAGGQIAALAFLAIGHDAPVARQFAKAVAELCEGNVHGVGQFPEFRQLVRVANIEQEFPVRPPRFRRNRATSPRAMWPATKPAVLMGSLAEPNGGEYARSSVSRSNTLIFAGDGGGQHVHSFVHPLFAQHLRAEQPARAFLGDDLDQHRFRAGIIMGVAVVAGEAGEESKTRLGRLRAVQVR